MEQTLERIGVSEGALAAIKSRSEEYASAVKRVRQSWRSSQKAREEYIQAAGAFQASVSLSVAPRQTGGRRRQEVWNLFKRRNGRHIGGRRRYACSSRPFCLFGDGQFCAAELLSLVRRQADDPVAKRLRLTMGSGHAIASVLDQIQRDEEDDKRQAEYDKKLGANPPTNSQPLEAEATRTRAKINGNHGLSGGEG